MIKHLTPRQVNNRLKIWNLELWQNAHLDYLDGYKSSLHLQKIADKESRLEALIKDKSKDISSYAVQLANWAYDVAGFAELNYHVADGANNDKPILLADYWKRIIVDCAKRTNIYDIHSGDLSELIDYLEDNIEVASSGIFGHTVLSLLNSARKSKEDFFAFGDISITTKGTVYKILDADASVEDANKIVLIQSAPTTEPKESEYPNKLAYLKARTRWDMARRHAESDAIRAELSDSVVANMQAPTVQEVMIDLSAVVLAAVILLSVAAGIVVAFLAASNAFNLSAAVVVRLGLASVGTAVGATN